MTTIVTRSGKGSPLENSELDSNFTNLNTDKVEKSGDSMTGNLSFGDGDKAIFGAGSDLQIYHDGTNSWVKESNATGSLFLDASNLYLRSDDGQAYLAAVKDSYVRLYYDDSIKLATTSTGIDVTGTVTADGLTVDGATVLRNTDYDNALNINRNLDVTSVGAAGTRLRFGAIYNGSDVYPVSVGGAVDTDGTAYNYNVLLDGNKFFEINSGGDISFYEDTGTTPKFFWDASAERLGIGTTSPSSQLDVNGNIRSRDGGIQLSTSTSNRGGLYTYDRITGSGTDYSVGLFSETGLGGLWFATGGGVTKRMVIDDSGRVGIGTSSPAYQLTVQPSSGNAQLGIRTNDTTSLAQLIFGRSDDSNRGGIYYDMSEESMEFHAGNTGEKMRIDSSGNVGIGTSSPSAPLTVNHSTSAGIRCESGGTLMGGFQANTSDAILYAYASNPIKFAQGNGGSERMRIDSDGQVGINTSSPYVQLESNVSATGAIPTNDKVSVTSGDSNIAIGAWNSSNSATFSGIALETRTTGASRWLIANEWQSSYLGDLVFRGRTGGSTSAEAMRITSSGNVGIGTSSPSQILELSDASTLRFDLSTSGLNEILSVGGTEDLSLRSGGNANVIFKNGSSEAMRIDSSGNLLVGRTSNYGGAYLQLGTSTSTNTKPRLYIIGYRNSSFYGEGIKFLAGSDVGAIACNFHNSGGTAVGSITTGSSSTAYNTSSDYRLKEDWQPMSGSIDRVKALNPVNFAWKSSGERVDGFLAHEAAEVVPEAVTGTKDAVLAYGNITDAEGTVVQEDVVEPETLEEGQTWTKVEDKPDYQGIDQSKLVPLLTSALQEAIAEIDSLKARVAALEN